MAKQFGLHTLVELLKRIGEEPERVDQEREMIKVSSYNKYGTSWSLFITLLRDGVDRMVMLHVPCFSSIPVRYQPQCFKAAMIVNYKAYRGRFGFSQDTGEIDLTEFIHVTNGSSVSYEEFNHAYRGILQTAEMFKTLFPRIIYCGLSAEAAITACEQEFDAEMKRGDESASEELNIADVLTEVNRILDEPKE